MEVGYTFVNYWKYCFTLRLEDGTEIRNREQDSDEIYRLGISQTGTAIKIEGKASVYYEVDGTVFIPL